MGWKILEITSAERLRLFLNNLVIFKNNDKITIPINDIDTLLIDNPQINLSIQLINKLTEANVNLILCDRYHLPTSQIFPVIGNYNSLKILNQQINWNNVFKSRIWTSIVKSKIQNQIETLVHFGYCNESTNEMQLLLKDVKEFDISNREGQAAKLYWHNLFGLKFNRRDEENLINKYLNYGYAILRSYFARAIVKKGLDPRISIFHKSFHNHFALASDLMEVFRILIDFEVIKIVEIDNFAKPWIEAKQQLVEAFNRKVIINNQEQFINIAIDIFVDALVSQKELPQISFPLHEWN